MVHMRELGRLEILHLADAEAPEDAADGGA